MSRGSCQYSAWLRAGRNQCGSISDDKFYCKFPSIVAFIVYYLTPTGDWKGDQIWTTPAPQISQAVLQINYAFDMILGSFIVKCFFSTCFYETFLSSQIFHGVNLLLNITLPEINLRKIGGMRLEFVMVTGNCIEHGKSNSLLLKRWSIILGSKWLTNSVFSWRFQ
jgi:hypothetical protein